MRRVSTALLMIGLLFAGVAIGSASNVDETTLTVQVTSADHELEEGYFTLGQEATVMVKPGSDLFRFLSRQRGNKVKIVLSQSAMRELSRIER